VDVTGGLLRLSVPRAFVIVAPGFTAVRLGVECELRLRGWSQALTPANADMLVMCGDDGDAFADPVGRLWAQIPSPRTFVRIVAQDDIARHFDQAKAALCDLAALRRDAVERSEADAQNMDMSDMDTSGNDHANAHADGHTMDMSMDMPGGLSMADRGPDRDGLKLDQLHVVLGPVLPDWPSGLVVRLVLQGDIVQSAELELVGVHSHSSFWLDAEVSTEVASQIRAAAAADSLQRFLGVAGWRSAAATGRWLRDELLASGPDVLVDPRFTRWIRRVRRSRVLRWSMNGLGLVGQDAPDQLHGDVSARYVRWADEITSALGGPVVGGQSVAPPWGLDRAERARAALTILPTMLVGQEFTAARLIVASFDPDLEALHAHALPDSHD
jgi:hypothetical protein